MDGAFVVAVPRFDLPTVIQKKLYNHSDMNAQFVNYFDLDQFVEWNFDYVISKISMVPAKDTGLCQE